jgi:predicted nucleic acid-binding protein
MTLVDTNVIIDVLTGDRRWLEWSTDQLGRLRQDGVLWINDIVYAELAARIDTETSLQATLTALNLRLQRIPAEALFIAGRAFHRYRRKGGSRTMLLPDFFIGAHAQVARLPILTRDSRPYRHYFPKVQIIAP